MCACARRWLSVLMSVIEPISTDVCPFCSLFVPPCLSTDVAKWTTLASQPALTLPVSGLFGLQQIQVPSFNLTNAVLGLGWLPLLYYRPKHSLSVILDAQGLSFSGFTSQISVPTFNTDSTVCIALSRGKGFVLAPLFCEPGWMACKPLLHVSYIIIYQMMLVCIFPFHPNVSVMISHFLFSSFDGSEILEPDFFDKPIWKYTNMGHPCLKFIFLFLLWVLY